MLSFLDQIITEGIRRSTQKLSWRRYFSIARWAFRNVRNSLVRMPNESGCTNNNNYELFYFYRYESWESCAIREVVEETGLEIHNVQFAHVTNDIMKEQGKHYVTIFMMGECIPPPSFLGMSIHPQPRNLEPHKCEGWESYSWEELCSFADESEDGNSDGNLKLFGPLLQLINEAPQSVIDFMSTS